MFSVVVQMFRVDVGLMVPIEYSVNRSDLSVISSRHKQEYFLDFQVLCTSDGPILVTVRLLSNDTLSQAAFSPCQLPFCESIALHIVA